MIEIRKAELGDAIIIHQLAHRIYFPTYTGILSESQMLFMLEKSYTEVALQESMQADQKFFLAYSDNLPVGFIALREKDENILRIEKLYLLPECQGKGFGKKLIDFAIMEALNMGKIIVELNVNRGNSAASFYHKIGFAVVEKVDIPYYGYVLDDFIMQKKIA
ncbi:MAG: GNAT family N-acetyltransferase [Sphingobacterium composti]